MVLKIVATGHSFSPGGLRYRGLAALIPIAALHYLPLYAGTPGPEKEINKTKQDPPKTWPIGLAGKTPVGKTCDAGIPGSRLPYIE